MTTHVEIYNSDTLEVYEEIMVDLTSPGAQDTINFLISQLQAQGILGPFAHREKVFPSDPEPESVNMQKAALVMVIDNGSSTITTGVKGDLYVPFDCTIERSVLLADRNGTIQIDVWRSNMTGYPPTNAGSITASRPPRITGSGNNTDDYSSLTGWTVNLTEGDVLRANVDSVTSIRRVTLILDVLKALS